MSWQEQALCAQIGTEVFFPEENQPSDQARAICRTCPVINDCLQYALDRREPHGVWGGKSARQRKTLLSERNRTLKDAA